MNKTIITVEKSFCDIDSLACAVAYKELLEKIGQPAVVFIPGQLNYSVGKTMNNLNLEYETVCPADAEKFVIVDVSNPDKFHKEVKTEQVVEIFDHHPGFEQFWAERLGEKSHIKSIGACATLIWEAFKKAGVEKNISSASANLLSAAIVSNTLNFNSPITSPRDHKAFEELKTFVDLPANWIEKYYAGCEEKILTDLESALRNDTKIEKIPGQNEPLVIGQLETWHPEKILDNNQFKIGQILKNMNSKHWMFNLLSLSEKKNYILTDDLETQIFLSDWLKISFNDNLAITNSFVLRKMIMKELNNRPWK